MSLLMGGPVLRDPPVELLPCPFCGGPPYFMFDGESHFIECYHCGARGPTRVRGQHELCGMWNGVSEACTKGRNNE